MGEDETRFIRPLSLEAIAALVVALINLALDQADIHIVLVSWLSVAACITLCIDALRRTQWIGNVGIVSGRFMGISLVIVVSFVALGVFLSHHKNHVAEIVQQPPPSEAPKQDKLLGQGEPAQPVPPQPAPRPRTTSHHVEQLSKLVLEGVQLKEQYQFRVCASGTSAEVLGKFVADINNWHHRVETYLEKMGVSYLARFENRANPPQSYPCAFDLNYHNAYGVWNSLSSDLERLTEFIKELTAAEPTQRAAKPITPKKQSGASTSGDDSPAVGSVTQGDGSAFSVNQRGGITAGTINLGPPPLVISKQQEAILTGSIRPFLEQFAGQKVNISLHHATSETEEFGKRLAVAFEAAGFHINEGEVDFVGATLDRGVTIRFGENRELMANAVRDALLSSKTVAKVYKATGISADDFLIIVAP